MSNRAKYQAILARIATLQAEADKLKPLAEAELDTTAIKAGDIIGFNYKVDKDTSKLMSGKVLGIQKPEKKGPTIIKVLHEAGIDTQVLSVFPSAVVSVIDPAAPIKTAEQQ